MLFRALLLWIGAGGSTAAQTLVIRDVTVVPMTDSVTALPRYTVLVRDGRVASVGPAAAVPIPAGAVVLDGAGRYLIPGLIEMHAHTSKTRASALGLYIVHGVTTIRDQGSEHAEVLRWRGEIRDGVRVGPRMLVAGPYLESRGNIERMRRDPPAERVEPFERARIAVAGPADARRIVDSLARLDVDHFKVRTVQDDATYVALGRAARAAGKRLTGHVVTRSIERLLESGQTGFDHGFPPTLDELPTSRRRAFWRELAARDAGVVPTMVVITESVLKPEGYHRRLLDDTSAHPVRPYLARFLVLDWREQANEQSALRRLYFRRAMPVMLKHLREMHAEGVRLMAGSDVAVLGIFPGASLHEELRLFVDSVGMTPMQALASATRSPAEWLGIADSVGTIAPGKVADFVLLDADPLENIRNTQRIHAVVLRGRPYRRAGLDSLRAAVRAMPDIRVNDWVR